MSNHVEFSLLLEVLRSVHAQSATEANAKWRLPAELPRIHATAPFRVQIFE